MSAPGFFEAGLLINLMFLFKEIWVLLFVCLVACQTKIQVMFILVFHLLVAKNSLLLISQAFKLHHQPPSHTAAVSYLALFNY